MDVYRTEEEQIEALKRWWRDNGKSLIVGVVLAVAAVFGWRAWQDARQQQAEAASELFFQLLDAAALAGQSETEAVRLTAQHLAQNLKQDHPKSTYAFYAALMAAKVAVDADDLATAERELQWAVDQSEAKSANRIIATLRLARVIYSSETEGSADRALSLLRGLDPQGHAPSYQELLGDIYLSQGNTEQARASYQAALEAVEAMGAQKPLLQLKLNDIAAEPTP